MMIRNGAIGVEMQTMMTKLRVIRMQTLWRLLASSRISSIPLAEKVTV
jgi:hypothetical protein